MRPKELTDILARLDGAAVECDGFVRLATTVLRHLGVPHRVMKGSVTGPLGQIPYHFWIEIDGTICDYRARMWLGPDAPHGIFAPSPDWAYTGNEEPMGSLPESVFFILAGQSVENVVGSGF